MYYEEKIINGVLCSRSTPNGEFKPIMPIKLNKRVIELEEKLNQIKTLVNKQAEDEGNWFEAKTAPEAYLQAELRELHRIIEEPESSIQRGLEDVKQGRVKPFEDVEKEGG